LACHGAEEALREFSQTGVRPEKVLVHADALLSWCRSHNRPNDSAARSAYVAELIGTQKADYA